MLGLLIECWKMGLRQLWRHRLRSFLTMIGIIVGVAVVIVCVTVVQGVKESLIQNIRDAGKNLIFVLTREVKNAGTVRGATGASQSNLTQADAEAIALECDAVSHACASHQAQMQVVSSYDNYNIATTGVTESYTIIRNWGVEEGRDLEPFDVVMKRRVCLIGKTAQRELFGDEPSLNKTLRIGPLTLRIVGILQAKGVNPLGMDEDNTILVPLPVLLHDLMGVRDPSAILCSAASDGDVEDAVDQIRSLLRQRHKLAETDEDDFLVTTLKEKEEQARDLSDKMTLLLFCIALFALLVGGVGIMNIMLVAVTERTREIGVRMAIGATRKAVILQFLLEAGILSSIGGLVGIAISIVVSIGVAANIGVVPVISPAIVLLAFGFSSGVGVLFGLLPARRAASLNPIEALRHD